MPPVDCPPAVTAASRRAVLQDNFRTAASYLLCDLAEMLRPRAPDQADRGSFSIRAPFEL